MTANENSPTVEEVFRILVEEMRHGSALPIVSGALTVFQSRYRGAFETRLAIPGKWSEEGANVRNAARQVGIIAGAIASLQNVREVTRQMVEQACDLAEEHCAIGYEEGRWCESDRSRA